MESSNAFTVEKHMLPTEGISPVNVVRVPIHPMTMVQVIELVDVAIARREPLRIGVVNAAKIVQMRQDQSFRDAVVSSDLVLADGMSVVWASRVLGTPLPERVTGIDLMLSILRRGHERGYRVYCLGATDEVLQKTIARIVSEYPGVKIAGSRNGYFTANEEAEIAAAIASCRADVLLVAISSPKKENFLARWGDRLRVPVCHGVGGSFDVLAGKVRRAPERWQCLGLEWLYRVLQEPGRLWRRYLVTNTRFTVIVLEELIRQILRNYLPQAFREPQR